MIITEKTIFTFVLAGLFTMWFYFVFKSLKKWW